MEKRTLLLALVLQLSLVALSGAAERCAQPGALRCEEGRHQSVCLERSRVWHRVSDCAAAGGFCADGRCVSKRSDDDSCQTPGQEVCTDDCQGVKVCRDGGSWFTYSCENGKACNLDSSGSASCVPTAQSTCVKTFECTITGNIPDLNNPSIYYVCSESQGNAKRSFCAEGEVFNACSGKCDDQIELLPEYPECERSGQSFSISTNPSLYIVCLGQTAIWDKCPAGYYESRKSKCAGRSIYCADCGKNAD